MTQYLSDEVNYRKENNAFLAQQVLLKIFKNYPDTFSFKLWDKSELLIGYGASKFTITIQSPFVLRDIVMFQDPVKLAEAYFEGLVEVEGDFSAAMNLRYFLENLKLPFNDKISLISRAIKLSNLNPSITSKTNKLPNIKRQNDIESIAFHYDVSNAFYGLWLDKLMVYSCAYFENPSQSLETAQTNKLDYICRKLRLKNGEHFLDIGCGWGALVCWAAKHYGVKAHGITLSQNQYEYACEEVRKQGLENQVKIEILHYRDLPKKPAYDKVSSIGMFEHVGLKNLTTYFSIVNRILKPDGLFLNHGITSDEPGWGRSTSTKFINRHVFPDGELDTISNIQNYMEETNFEIFDVEGLRQHYALTLRHWVARLEAMHDEVVRLVGQRTYRIWRLYMTGSAIQFEQGATGIYQILASPKKKGLPNIPLTRHYLYPS